MSKTNGLLLFISLFSMFGCSSNETAAEQQPEKAQTYQLVNPNATAETKKLFNVLSELYGQKIISGVVANVDWNYRDAENVFKWTGRWPAINVFDFMNIHASKDVNPKGWLDYSDDTCVREWHEAGGIVGCMWHWQVYANDGVNLTCSPGTKPGETSFDPSKVYVDGTDVWYLGDDVVDIIGRDNYAALQYPLMKEFKQLQKTYPNKMITLAECDVKAWQKPCELDGRTFTGRFLMEVGLEIPLNWDYASRVLEIRK